MLIAEELAHGDYSADLLSGDGSRRVGWRYGSGETAAIAALRARERYEQEQ